MTLANWRRPATVDLFTCDIVLVTVTLHIQPYFVIGKIRCIPAYAISIPLMYHIQSDFVNTKDLMYHSIHHSYISNVPYTTRFRDSKDQPLLNIPYYFLVTFYNPIQDIIPLTLLSLWCICNKFRSWSHLHNLPLYSYFTITTCWLTPFNHLFNPFLRPYTWSTYAWYGWSVICYDDVNVHCKCSAIHH